MIFLMSTNMRCSYLLVIPTMKPFFVLAFAHSSRLFSSTRSTASLSTTALKMASRKNVVVDPFCYRQFGEKSESKSYTGTVFDISVDKFEEIVNERYEGMLLNDGYAPFCKHLFLENDFTDAKTNALLITPENYHCLRSKYEARNEKELPVLTRWFCKKSLQEEIHKAKYLDLILYSRAQINKENEAQGRPKSDETAPWGIVSIKAQDVDYELPMTPITMMRNALGREEGGSGVKLDHDKYMDSVKYWNDHAVVDLK